MSEFASLESEPTLRKIDTFDGGRDKAMPSARLEEVRARSRAFRDEMLAGGKVLFYKTCELVRVPYPTRYAFANCFTQRIISTPAIHIVNRLFIIQYQSTDGVKTLLFSPSDIWANAETRFFKRIAGGKLPKLAGGAKGGRLGGVMAVAQKLVAPICATVEEWLERVGIAPEDVDYISYDHLHTQDIRRWLGSGVGKPFFPRAKLLVMRREWESAQGLLPTQLDWYCPQGTDGVDPAKVVLLDDDVRLGDGLAFVRTPGHTMGNHSLVAHTDEGVLVSSENGVSADVYEPTRSRIAPVRRYAKATGCEVILNGNTQESAVDQYISMMQEKEIAGPSQRNPEFANVVPSSEFSSHWLFPGFRPTFEFGSLELGRLQPRSGKTHAAA